MKIKFMKDAVVEQLSSNLDKYAEEYNNTNKSPWVKKEWLLEFKHEIPKTDLDMSKKRPEETDLDNIKILYSKLKSISDSQACDERLWAGLCHDVFWEYMQYRWPSKDPETIKQHYFFGDNHPKMLNGLARLWWTARLTYDETSKKPFELTEYLCQDLNGRGTALFAVSFSSNRRVLKIFLRTLMEFEKKRKLSREEFNDVKKMMVLWGGKLLLDSLSDKELSNKINNHLIETYLNKKETTVTT